MKTSPIASTDAECKPNMNRWLFLGLLAGVGCCGHEGWAGELQLINPDGAAASDARSVLLTSNQPVRLTPELEQWPAGVTESNQAATASAPQTGATVNYTAGDKVAVVNSSQGFAFVPLETATDTYRLLPHGTIALDTSNFDDEFKASHQVRLVWSNCFASLNLPPLAEEFQGVVDWRFYSMATLTYVLPMQDAEIAVPPGDIWLMVTEAGFEESEGPNGQGQAIGFWPVSSGKATDLQIPGLGAITGRLEMGDGLPNWGAVPGNSKLMVWAEKFSLPDFHVATQYWPFEQEMNRPVAQWSADERDLFARFCASPEGRQFRQGNFKMFSSKPVADNGGFELSMLPAGEYDLFRVNETSQTVVKIEGRDERSHTRVFSQRGQLAAVDASDQPLRVSVEAGETSKLGELKAVFQKNVSPLDGTGYVPAIGSGQFPAAPPGYAPLAAGPTPVPVYLAPSGTAYPYANAPQYPVPSYYPPVHLGTSQAGPALYPTPARVQTLTPSLGPSGFSPTAMVPTTDAAAQGLIDSWLATHQPSEDRTELKDLLRKQLEQSLDAADTARRQELQQLEELITKSRLWLDQRQKRREQIVEKKLAELLEQVPAR